MCVINFLKFNT